VTGKTAARLPATTIASELAPIDVALVLVDSKGNTEAGRVAALCLRQDGFKCPVGRVSAAEIKAAVIDQIRGILRAPEVVMSTWRAAQPDCEGLAEDEVRHALAVRMTIFMVFALPLRIAVSLNARPESSIL
jgi:hypothetical protein